MRRGDTRASRRCDGEVVAVRGMWQALDESGGRREGGSGWR